MLQPGKTWQTFPVVRFAQVECVIGCKHRDSAIKQGDQLISRGDKRDLRVEIVVKSATTDITLEARRATSPLLRSCISNEARELWRSVAEVR